MTRIEICDEIYRRVVSTLRFRGANKETPANAKQFAKGKFGGPQCARQRKFADAAAVKFLEHSAVRSLGPNELSIASRIYVDTVSLFRTEAELGETILFGAPQCGREIDFAVKAAKAKIP